MSKAERAGDQIKVSRHPHVKSLWKGGLGGEPFSIYGGTKSEAMTNPRDEWAVC